MNDFTSPPWRVSEYAECRIVRDKLNDSRPVAIMVGDYVLAVVWDPAVIYSDEKRCRANARLMAAAPDLLAACKEAETQFAYLLDQMASAGEWYPNADSECASRLKTLRAAITKAGGTT